MLAKTPIVAFVATTNSDRARAFYQDVLGLQLIEDSPFAVVFDAAGTMLRVQKVHELKPHPFTTLGWNVRDIAATARELKGRGVELMRVPGLEQDDLGVWTAPGGAKVAWFHDPDGNTLSISQHD